MVIDHIAIWTNGLEKLRLFYGRYFDAVASGKYINSKKGFESYFLSFSTGTRLEIMQRDDIYELKGNTEDMFIGITHIAFKLSSKDEVDQLTNRLQDDNI